jgi:hypothetical protein
MEQAHPMKYFRGWFWPTTALAVAAFILSIIGLYMSVNASNQTAKEANKRAAAVQQTLTREQATHCAFYNNVGSFSTTNIPSTDTAQKFKGTIEAARLASKNLGCAQQPQQ